MPTLGIGKVVSIVIEIAEKIRERFPMKRPKTTYTPTGYGLYKCQDCDKMVMGYEKENHLKERHGRVSVEWKKIR